MKYLEEIKSGDLFLYNSIRYIVTTDYKKSKTGSVKRMCVNVQNGSMNWIDDDAIISGLDLYYRDNEGNILALKEIKNEYSDQVKNIF